ncbi:MAG TPA: NAD(P)H-binding protein [Acidimicrobiales bacterium]|nr:NAD(P)H-binding protein [Acidimicrobiales bacterium]
MRVFLAGASGVIGIRLIPLLAADGRHVTAMTRSHSKADALRYLGADPIVCDVFDTTALCEAVIAAGPDVIMSQITDLPDELDRFGEFGAANARIHREGTQNLLAAAHAAGVARFIARSVAWAIPGDGGAAVEDMERAVLSTGGTVIRYGQIYGDGTYHEAPPALGPIVHVDTAARRTLVALATNVALLTVVD